MELFKLKHVNDGIDAGVDKIHDDAEMVEVTFETEVVADVVEQEVELVAGPAENESGCHQSKSLHGVSLSFLKSSYLRIP